MKNCLVLFSLVTSVVNATPPPLESPRGYTPTNISTEDEYPLKSGCLRYKFADVSHEFSCPQTQKNQDENVQESSANAVKDTELERCTEQSFTDTTK